MSNKTRKKQLKQIENQAQQGRSMVEMLGVLAVIGVISIGGISGYRMAMNRYQANQIANEINLMRTDAKIKVAQGAEELLLGSPYDDEKHLKFNANYGVAVEFEDIETETPGETETGYSFALSGIPAGVCKPLATLLDGMDDTAVLEINGKDYETAEIPCDNEENEVMVAFSTKDLGVSGGGKECDEATCEGYCSADGACKNCPEDAPWDEATRQCKCSSSQHWNKEIEECAACGDNSHCTSSSYPICNAEGKCDTCKNVYPDTPNWNGSECVATCPEDKPVLYSNQCVECRTNSDCDKKGDGKHYWCDTGYYANYGTCNQCADWDEEKQRCKIGECESNADCKEGEYCYLYRGYSCTSEFDKSKGFGEGSDTYKSECRKAESDINKSGDISSKYIISTKVMTWWSAKRFCEALPGNKHMVTISELQCRHKIQYSGGECIYGYCHAEGSEMACNKSSTSDDVSSGVKELSKAYNGKEDSRPSQYLWLSDPYGSNDSSCFAYRVYLYNGYLDYISRGNGSFDYALCE